MHQAQQILRRLVVGRIIMTPVAERGLNPTYYTFSARGTVRPLIGNVPVGMASRTGSNRSQTGREWIEISRWVAAAIGVMASGRDDSNEC